MEAVELQPRAMGRMGRLLRRDVPLFSRCLPAARGTPPSAVCCSFRPAGVGLDSKDTVLKGCGVSLGGSVCVSRSPAHGIVGWPGARSGVPGVHPWRPAGNVSSSLPPAAPQGSGFGVTAEDVERGPGGAKMRVDLPPVRGEVDDTLMQKEPGSRSGSPIGACPEEDGQRTAAESESRTSRASSASLFTQR